MISKDDNGLKSCPFCGGKAEMVSDFDDEHYVYCTGCKGGGKTMETPEEAAAAWNRRAEREKAQLGNAAAMREALEFCTKRMNDAICDKDFGDDVMYLVGCMKTCIERMKHALSDPPRNCDIGDVDEQERRYRASTDEAYHTLTLTNVLKWAQMPYSSYAEWMSRRL